MKLVIYKVITSTGGGIGEPVFCYEAIEVLERLFLVEEKVLFPPLFFVKVTNDDNIIPELSTW